MATLIVATPILIVIFKNLSHSISIGSQIRAVSSESRLYQERITADSLLLESIKFDEGLERYAREKYFMQRKGEQIFILER